MHAWISLPSASSLGMPENALFSEVFDTFLHAVFETASDKKKGDLHDVPITLNERINRLEMMRARLADWIIEIPDKALEEFEQAVTKSIDDAGKKCGKDNWHSIALRQNAITEATSREKDSPSASASAHRIPHSPEKSIEGLTNVSLKGKSSGMKSEIHKLIERVKQKASQPGAKSQLARELDVAPARISEWLSGGKEPGGEYALRLLKWVES